LVLLYGRTVRRGQRLGQIAQGHVPVEWMLAGYLSVWLAFSVLAAGLQTALAASGLISGMMLWSESRWLSAGLLALAAVFQMTPLKRTCLSACRQPVAYLSGCWRPGRRGALHMGLIHGADCLGCCWALMLLLFVGGAMNLIWIAALGGLVLIERLAPFGPRSLPVTAGILALWAGVTLLV
jgi:predicted metal-binding membrane protein